MKKMMFMVFVALAVIAAAACQNNPAGPKLSSAVPGMTDSKDSGSEAATSISASSLMGTWRATKAMGWNSVPKGSGWSEVPGSRQDLVAAGGTVTLALVPNDQPLGLLIPPGRYTITVAMPGKNPGVDTGFWTFGPAWQEKNKGFYQMDFWPASLGPEPGYGEIPAFLVTLSGDSLKLWDSGLTFLPFNFGEGCTSLELEFIRQ